MTDEIEVPTVLREPKPWWLERPNDQIVREIYSFIQRTKLPHLWPGQTYNHPPEDSIPIYLTEFHLPQSVPLAPCPCCTPKHGKYHFGIVAYFPQEHVIRIMGHDCFKSINAERHNEALRSYHAEKQRKKDIQYLLDNLDKVRDLISIIEHAVPIGHAVDDLRSQAIIVFKQVLRADLWEHIRTGHLVLTRYAKQVIFVPGRGEEEHEGSFTETYGHIAGQNFLRPGGPRLAPKLRNAVMALQHIDFGPDFKDRIPEMSDTDRRTAAKLLNRAIRDAIEAFGTITEYRRFTSAQTIATLNGWSRQPECPVHMVIQFDGSSLSIGRSEYEVRRLEVPPAYLSVLRQLPENLTKVAVA